MSSGEKVDPTETYVLEETAITKVKSLEELAELALREIAEPGDETASKNETESPNDHNG